MKFTLKNAGDFGWEGLKGKAYSTAEDFANASGAYFEVTGSHGKTKSTKSDRVYFIIEGQGEFIVDDKVIEVAKSDMIIMPKNKVYDYKAKNGVMKMFLVHTPAYDSDADIKLE